MANSQLCERLDVGYLENRKKELSSKNALKFTMHFEYHQLDEREMAERCISPFSDVSSDERILPDAVEEWASLPIIDSLQPSGVSTLETLNCTGAEKEMANEFVIKVFLLQFSQRMLNATKFIGRKTTRKSALQVFCID